MDENQQNRFPLVRAPITAPENQVRPLVPHPRVTSVVSRARIWRPELMPPPPFPIVTRPPMFDPIVPFFRLPPPIQPIPPRSPHLLPPDLPYSHRADFFSHPPNPTIYVNPETPRFLASPPPYEDQLPPPAINVRPSQKSKAFMINNILKRKNKDGEDNDDEVNKKVPDRPRLTAPPNINQPSTSGGTIASGGRTVRQRGQAVPTPPPVAGPSRRKIGRPVMENRDDDNYDRSDGIQGADFVLAGNVQAERELVFADEDFLVWVQRIRNETSDQFRSLGKSVKFNN